MTKDEALVLALNALTKGTYEQKLAATHAIKSVLGSDTPKDQKFIGWAVFDGKGRFSKLRTNKTSAETCLRNADMKFAETHGAGYMRPVFVTTGSEA